MDRFLPLVLLSLLMASCNVDKGKMSIYVEPFYNSKPFKIAVGEYSAKLTTNSKVGTRSVANEIKERIDEVIIETLFVLPIRLYDLGLKDEASYWYYAARLRKNIFIRMEDRATYRSNMGDYLQAFKRLSGQWINGYSYGNPDKLAAILEQVVEDNRNMAYIRKAYPTLYVFKPEEKQMTCMREQVDAILEHAKYIRENKEEMLQTRKVNEMTGVKR
ncbi:MAG: hypothetical protein LBG19_03340 [Prevotellaceae bacterium]|jgi:hypothetical protein|nr:hypothetical protein [Prevotellaceae bacterium]